MTVVKEARFSAPTRVSPSAAAAVSEGLSKGVLSGGAATSGAILNPSESARIRRAIQQDGGIGPLSCYFPMDEGTGASCYGAPNAIPLTLIGGVGWGPLKGINFNGTGYAQVDATAYSGLLRSIFNLDSLTPTEMIMFSGVVHHGIALNNTSTIFCWGRHSSAGAEGWAMELTSTLNLRFRHTGLGGSTTFLGCGITNLNASTVAGLNKFTAICGGISRTLGGDLELMTCIRYLDVPGDYQNINRASVITPLPKPGGASRSCRYAADTGLTFGALPGSGPSSVSNVMSAGASLYNWDFSRGPRDPGKLHNVVRELSASALVRAASLNAIIA